MKTDVTDSSNLWGMVAIILAILVFGLRPADAQSFEPTWSMYADNSEWEYIDETETWIRLTEKHGRLTFKLEDEKMQYSVTVPCPNGRTATYTWHNFDPEGVAEFGCIRKDEKIFIRHIRPYFRSLPDWARTGRKPAEIPVEKYFAGTYA